MEWELKEVGDTEWIQDNSKCYTLIHHIKDDIVRIDFMNDNDIPIISFQGTADNVRKYIMQHIDSQWSLSLEHASYIGAELARCAILQDKYVQD